MDFDAPVMMAYIGLGAGLGPAGCLLAVGSAVLLTLLLILVGFTLYPAREILRRWRWWRNRARGGGERRKRWPAVRNGEVPTPVFQPGPGTERPWR